MKKHRQRARREPLPSAYVAFTEVRDYPAVTDTSSMRNTVASALSSAP